MKRLISILLSIVLVFTTLGGFSFTAYSADTVASGDCGQNGNNVVWTLTNDGVITITANGNEPRIKDYSAQSTAPWYNYRDQIRKVVIQNGVIQVGAFAFYDCYNIVDVEFGTIDTLGTSAFEKCTSLKRAILPDSCTWIWNYAFSGCTGLVTAYVNAVNSYSNTIPEGMFNHCESLAVIELGENINRIGNWALEYCYNLEALIWNSSYIYTDTNALRDSNANMTIVSVPNSQAVRDFANNNGYKYDDSISHKVSDNDSLTYTWNTKDSTLYFTGSGNMTTYENGSQPWQIYTKAMRKVDFSKTDGLVSISTTAFQGRDAIEEVDFTNVQNVGWGAFAECYSLKDAKFKACLESVWNYAFANGTSINTVTFEDGEKPLRIYDGAFKNCSSSTYWINLPENIRKIGIEAFWKSNFNYVTFTRTKEKIEMGDRAFGNESGGYARFIGPSGTNNGIFDFVKNHREKFHYNWYYYCEGEDKGKHYYSNDVVSPECLKGGYDIYHCIYCDFGSYKSDFTSPLGHNYKYLDAEEGIFNYTCRRCYKADLSLTNSDVFYYFENGISNTAGKNKFNQTNYFSAADINGDGVINAKDYVLMMRLFKAPNVENKQTTIDLASTHQTIEGFGASACWWSQTVGNWETADEILGLLYDPVDGIGLNVYRYNLGAGSRDIDDKTMTVENNRTNCFLQADGTYNWNNDSGAMRALELARKHNKDLKVTLFANSPPVYMTKNGKAYCDPIVNDDRSPNLPKNKYSDFADYMIKCAEHFISEGYNVTDLSPINEPEFSWDGSNQEGCRWSETEALDFYNNYLIPKLKKKDLNVGVSVWESGSMRSWDHWDNFLNNLFSSKGREYLGSLKWSPDYKSKNQNIREYVDTVDVHSYWADTEARRNVANDLRQSHINRKIRCSEYCQMYNDYNSGVVSHSALSGPTNGMDIDYGLAMADIIYQELTILDAVEWDWWTACARGIYPDGLVYVYDGDHGYQTAKRLWCLGNYSKFIKEGAVRVDVSTGDKFGKNLKTKEENIYTWTDEYGNVVTDKNNYMEQSAYKNPDGSVAVVYINHSDTTEFTKFDSNQFKSFSTYVTDTNRDLENVQNDSTSSVVYIPARSVTTVVLR